VELVKFVRKLPTFSPEKQQEYLSDGWILLREPKYLALSIFLSVPLMFVLGAIAFWVMGLFGPLSWEAFGITKVGDSFSGEISLLLIPLILAVLLLHELIHLVMVPNFLTSPTTVFGLTWFGGFAYTEEVLARNRFILVALMPFVLISVVLPVVLGLSGLLGASARLCIFLNAAACSVDFFNIFLVLWQVPRHGRIAMNGPITYFRR
jgi:hypothetical protein